MNLKHLFTYIMLICSGMTVSAQDGPANIPGDFADPSIIRSGNTYYAIGTSSEWAPHFPIFKSTNLSDWQQTGFVFDQAPAWTKASFWAPEYYFHKGTYYVYYTARRKSDGVSCIGVATSKFPDRDFTDHGIIIAYGKEAIDAFVYNDNGQLYISWKAYGLDKRPIEILGSKLSDDGLSLIGEPFMMLKDTKGQGIEGQSMLKQGDYYYLFYSAGACCGIQCSYHVNVARSKTITGPYEDYNQNPILTNRDGWKCPGHGTFVHNQQGKTYYIYHAYRTASNVFTGREGLVSPLRWTDNGWPAFDGQLLTQQYLTGMRYNFAQKHAPIYWQWDFRHMQPIIQENGGKLDLSGRHDTKNLAGVAITLRPYSSAYEIQTSVLNTNDADKGLIVYGDISASVGISVHGNQVAFWAIKDSKKEVLQEITLSSTSLPVYLKLKVLPDFTCRVYWKQQADWQELTANNEAYSIRFLPPWDRSPRPGLHVAGKPQEKGSFGFFELQYMK